MPNYLNLLGEYYPSMEAYCTGDPTVYAQVIQLGSPVISQVTLDALTETPDGQPIEVPFGSPLPEDADILQYSASDNTWHYATLTDAGVSSSAHTHAVEDLSNTTITSVAAGEVLVFQGSPAEWQNNTLAEAGISAVGHAHNKSDISDFTESDYVHTTGNETVAGNKTFSNNITVTGDLTVNGTTTSVNSTTLEIGDNIYLLNADLVGSPQGSPLPSPTQDAGFEVERGHETNVLWVWDETNDTFRPELGAGEAHLGYVLDPTTDNHVGDRGYNDLRYSNISHTHALDDLTDVNVGSPVPQTNNILTYTGSVWKAGQGYVCRQFVYGAIPKASGTSTIPDDDTLPTVSEGHEIWSADITPGTTTAVVKVSFSITVDIYQGGGMGGGDFDVIVSVFRDSTNIGGMSTNITDYDEQQMSIVVVDAPSTTSQVTYSARIGKKSGESGTWYVNRLQTEKYGGMLEKQGYILEELDQG